MVGIARPTVATVARSPRLAAITAGAARAVGTIRIEQNQEPAATRVAPNATGTADAGGSAVAAVSADPARDSRILAVDTIPTATTNATSSTEAAGATHAEHPAARTTITTPPATATGDTIGPRITGRRPSLTCHSMTSGTTGAAGTAVTPQRQQPRVAPLTAVAAYPTDANCRTGGTTATSIADKQSARATSTTSTTFRTRTASAAVPEPSGRTAVTAVEAITAMTKNAAITARAHLATRA